MLRFTKASMVLLISLLIFTGCDTANQMMRSMPTETATDMETGPANLVWLIHYSEPAGHEASEAYFNALESIMHTVNEPSPDGPVWPNVVKIYQNLEDSRPLWFLEFEFDSFLDAKAYMNRQDIMNLFDDIVSTTLSASSHIFVQRSDYEKNEGDAWPVKGIILVEYHPGGKAAYLEWVASISNLLTEPPELQAIASYDNASGEAPHRLVTLEFESQEDATAYEELEEIMAIEAELDVRASRWSSHTFELRTGFLPILRDDPEPIEEPDIAPHTIEYSSGLIVHVTAEQFEQITKDLESRTFENAAGAIASEKVVAYIDSVKAWAEKYCEQKFSSIPPPELFITFRTAEERQKFFDAMPGVYVTLVDRDAYLDLTGDSVFEPDPSINNPPWWAFKVDTLILDNKSTYFLVEILPAFPCEMLR